MLLVVSGPSSVGKSKVIKELLKIKKQYSFVVSHTTRKQRLDEIDGVDYIFIDEREFEYRLTNGYFVQYKEGPLGRYGTSVLQLEKAKNGKQIPVLDVDPDGYSKLRGKYDNVLGIFLLPPSREILWERLASRGEARGIYSLDDAKIRFKYSCNCADFAICYDYILVNRDAYETAKQINSIVEVSCLKNDREHFYKDWLEDKFNI